MGTSCTAYAFFKIPSKMHIHMHMHMTGKELSPIALHRAVHWMTSSVQRWKDLLIFSKNVMTAHSKIVGNQSCSLANKIVTEHNLILIDCSDMLALVCDSF